MTTQRFGHHDVQRAMDINLATHMSWIATQLATMRVADSADVLVVDSGLSCDTFNIITRARFQLDTAERRVREAIAHFDDVNRPFSWWVGPSDTPAPIGRHLEAAGLAAAESETGMALQLTELTARRSDSGLVIERATTVRQLADYAAVVAANWSPPDPNVLDYYLQAGAVVFERHSPLQYFIGYLNGEPVASAELCIAGGVGGLYSIATREPFRRRGFGRAMTLAPLLAAREMAVETAVLQASADGLPVYARLGFVATGEYAEYQRR